MYRAANPDRDALQPGVEPAVREDHGAGRGRAAPAPSRPRRGGAGDREGFLKVRVQQILIVVVVYQDNTVASEHGLLNMLTIGNRLRSTQCREFLLILCRPAYNVRT